jgi:hypothetical protein
MRDHKGATTITRRLRCGVSRGRRSWKLPNRCVARVPPFSSRCRSGRRKALALLLRAGDRGRGAQRISGPVALVADHDGPVSSAWHNCLQVTRRYRNHRSSRLVRPTREAGRPGTNSLACQRSTQTRVECSNITTSCQFCQIVLYIYYELKLLYGASVL